MTTIRIAEYAPSPGGRFVADGPSSGEWFRNEVLRPAVAKAIETGEKVAVELDGAAGYGSSFLEEAFGGLIRVGGFADPQKVRDAIVLVAKDDLYSTYKDLAERYMRNASPERPRPAAA